MAAMRRRWEDMMADDPRLELPKELRSAVEASLEQARKALDGMVMAAHQALDEGERRGSRITDTAREASRTAMDYITANMTAGFDFAARLAKARTVQEWVKLQQSFAAEQAHRLSEQVGALGATVGSVQRSAAAARPTPQSAPKPAAAASQPAKAASPAAAPRPAAAPKPAAEVPKPGPAEAKAPVAEKSSVHEAPAAGKPAVPETAPPKPAAAKPAGTSPAVPKPAAPKAAIPKTTGSPSAGAAPAASDANSSSGTLETPVRRGRPARGGRPRGVGRKPGPTAG
nr:phasin family protein [Ancylobacter crimeensis]